jgi:hypothetical protein
MPKTEEQTTVSSVRVDLGTPLEGHHVQIDTEAITLGFIEDLQSQQMGPILDGLSTVIVGGDLVGEPGVRPWLRTLRVPQFNAVAGAINAAMVAVPKES